MIKKACLENATLREAFYESERLKIIETGSASPCLDLSRIDIDLAKLIEKNKVDLVILEGMGRAIHTNYNAQLKCDSLKIAVLKNMWLAERFGFVKDEKSSDKLRFPIIFKYEKRVQ